MNEDDDNSKFKLKEKGKSGSFLHSRIGEILLVSTVTFGYVFAFSFQYVASFNPTYSLYPIYTLLLLLESSQ